MLLYRAIRWGRSVLALSRIGAITGTMALWGMIDEAHQVWIPGRMMESGDLIADVAGAAVGAAMAALASRSSRERRGT